MKSYSCGVLPSTTDYHHQRLRRKPSLAISVLIFACILFSSIVLFVSKSTTTSNHPNVNHDDIQMSAEESAAGNHHSGVSGGGTSKVFVAQSDVHFHTLNDDNHRNMQTSSPQRCINISIFLDEYPADTSWTIIDDSTTTGNAVATSPTYDATMALTQQLETICLAAPGTYSFIISDDYEDGICCVWGEGNYTLTTSSTVIDGESGGDVQVLAAGGAWKGPNETTTFELLAAPTPPTNMPTVQPTMMMYIEPVESVERMNVTTQVNIYLTGVPSNQNMTTTEQEVFESLFYTVLQSRLETVDVGILEVVVDTQINDPQFDAESPFDSSQSDSNGGGETKLSSVLQLVTNVTLTYSDPPPEGWRDWSIYLTSWIESFGPTMVDIFTDPKHDLYPNQDFFNTISDVSGTNVVPPNTDPTMSPTLAPTYLRAPEYKKPLVTGLAVAGVVVVVLFFGGAVWWKWRRVGLARTHNIGNGNVQEEEEEEEREKKNEELEEEEELGSIDEDDSLPQDVVVASLPSSSTVPKSNSNDVVHDDDEEGEVVINDDESDDDDESESEENIVTSLPMIIEETPPTPRQESPTLAPPVPNELQDDDVQYNEIVAAVMANDPNLTQVVLDNKRQIGNNDGGEALWEALTTNNHVQLLSLRNSNITDDQMAALALALNENTSISRLSLQNNNMFTSEGVEYLIVCLECNSTIDVVDLEGNSPIDPRILDELYGILQSRGGVPNHSNKLELLLERIRGNDPNLTQLDLRGMGIGQEDNDAIMDALAGNAYLRKVDLSNNMIDDDGVSALSLALADNTSITHMCLAENRITSIGAEYLLCALDTNDTIVDVDLAGNSIDAGVIAELNHALKQRRT